MASIKKALSRLPARPALVAAPLIALLALALYYWDLHANCTDLRADREALYAHLERLPPGTRFRLADFTEFAWNQVRVIARLESTSRELDCPLDWNWPRGERDELLRAGRLAAVIFGQDRALVDYLELRNDRIEFRGVDSILSPATAVFRVVRDGGADGTISLTPVAPAE